MPTLREELRLAVDTARSIIEDGAATEATEDDLALADIALLRAGDSVMPPDEINALAKVAALGIEYLIAVDDTDGLNFTHMRTESNLTNVLTLTFGSRWND
jgi:hypothetical protein